VSTVNTFLIVRGGPAAGKAAEVPREHGHRGPLGYAYPGVTHT
jgi:hypothetical protein